MDNLFDKLDSLLWLLGSPFNRKWQAFKRECKRDDEEIAQHWKKQQALANKFAEAIERPLRLNPYNYHFRVGKDYKHWGMWRGTFFMYYDETLANDEVVFVLGKYNGKSN